MKVGRGSSRLLFGLVLLGVIFLCGVTGYTGKSKSSIKPIPRLDCSSFDPAKIKLISFDVFGALMDSYNSVVRNVAFILPSLPSSQVSNILFARILLKIVKIR